MAVVAKVVEPGRSVARMIAPVIWRLGALVAVMAAVCVIGIVLSIQTVSTSTDVVDPTDRAHDQVVRDLEDVQASVTGWELSGSRTFRVDFALSQEVLDSSMDALLDQAAELPDVLPAVESEVARVRMWLGSYARPRLAAPGGASRRAASWCPTSPALGPGPTR